MRIAGSESRRFGLSLGAAMETWVIAVITTYFDG